MADDVSDRMEPGNAPAATPDAPGKKRLPPAAERALAEAAARRTERDRARQEQVAEFPRRGGLDPVRYGDWEVNGVVSDF